MTAVHDRPSLVGIADPAIIEHEGRGPRAKGPARDAQLLLQAMRELSRARSPEAVAEIVKVVARALVDADGATFVLRDAGQCFYVDEDAISPLWKGQRFPAETCVSGWVMDHAEQAVMEDIYADERVPVVAYRPTFVKSLVMTPVRRKEPVAAIGIYWAHKHRANERELALLQDLADTTAVALESIAVCTELERRVAERTEQLTQVNRELEAFSYSVAHDLRTPLSAILGFAELIEDRVPTDSDPHVSMFASEIVGAGKRMNGLIGALLDFSRCASAAIEREQVDVSSVARALCERLQAEHERSYDVRIEPLLRAHADPSLLEIVLSNLLANAFKYAGKRVDARIEVGALAEDEGAARGPTFYVRDNGAGFESHQAEQLFVPFKRLHAQHEFEGTGVGLATVARIVRRHGGRIWAEGRPNQGATFYFSLPDER